VWEVEFGYLPPEFVYRSKGSLEPEWTTIPIRTISYIDQYDLPLEVHHGRARAILAMGAQFADVGGLEAGAMLVFRPFGVKRFVEDCRRPEMDWFDIPVRGKPAVKRRI
jgi:hypothetical protein